MEQFIFEDEKLEYVFLAAAKVGRDYCQPGSIGGFYV